MQIIELDSFMTAFPVQPGEEDAAKRRFMTLLGEPEAHAKVGGTSYVSRAWTLSGEPLALKRLLPDAGIPQGATLSDEDTARITQGHAAAFYEEYRNQLQVSHLRGFPRLYGYGSIAGTPAIVMEWVEGQSLRRLMRDSRERGEQLPARIVAAIGTGVLEILESLGRLDSALAHRDISPANILIRTTGTSLEEQLERESFDLCLIDFGSSASEPAASNPSFTTVTHLWRNGTPEYAPPEMLTRDLPHVDDLRKSQKIDVFALCSVLYELYSGHTPWRVSEHAEASPYRLKTEQAPEPLTPRCAEDELLTRAIASGLAAQQEDRPSVRELLIFLNRYLGQDDKPAQDAGGQVQPAETSGPESPEDAQPDSTTPGPTTPDSVNLQVADKAQGGKRAGEAVPAFREETGKPISRRSLIVGGAAIAVGAALGGGLYINSETAKNSIGAHSIHDAALANQLYDGAPLYLARDYFSNAWQLVSESMGPISLDCAGREPGVLAHGLVRVYHAESKGYGFKTAESEGSQPLETKWAFNRTFANAKDYSATNAADPQSPWFAAVQDPETHLWGYIDSAGDDAIGAHFTTANPFSNGYASVKSTRSPNSWSLIDPSGGQSAISGFQTLGQCSEENLIAALTESFYWIFIDPYGNQAFEGRWRDVARFECGLAGAYDSESGLWGFIGSSGAYSIEPRYLEVRPFSKTESQQALAPAKDSGSRLWGLVDTSGNWVVKPRFLKIGERTGALWPAHGSPADTYNPDSSEWESYLKTGGDQRFGYGYIDESGSWALKPTFGDVLIRASAR